MDIVVAKVDDVVEVDGLMVEVSSAVVAIVDEVDKVDGANGVIKVDGAIAVVNGVIDGKWSSIKSTNQLYEAYPC